MKKKRIAYTFDERSYTDSLADHHNQQQASTVVIRNPETGAERMVTIPHLGRRCPHCGQVIK